MQSFQPTKLSKSFISYGEKVKQLKPVLKNKQGPTTTVLRTGFSCFQLPGLFNFIGQKKNPLFLLASDTRLKLLLAGKAGLWTLQFRWTKKLLLAGKAINPSFLLASDRSHANSDLQGGEVEALEPLPVDVLLPEAE